MESLLNNVWFLSLVAWPGVLITCACINMLLQWSFSWSELVIDHLIGIAIGVCFYFGTEPHAHPVLKFLLVFSDGLPGLLSAVGVKALQSREMLFLVSAAVIGGSVLLSGLLDKATLVIDTSMNVPGGILSIAILAFKLPFSFCTTALGYLMWLIGLFVSFASSTTRVGFLGGVPYVEWNYTDANRWATTFGAAVMVWKGDVSTVIKHELYHTRQYIYLHDWLIPFYPVAGLWGIISAAIATSRENPIDVPGSFWRAQKTREVGNPLERAAYASEAGA